MVTTTTITTIKAMETTIIMLVLVEVPVKRTEVSEEEKLLQTAKTEVDNKLTKVANTQQYRSKVTIQ